MFEYLVEFSREDSLGCFSFSWEQRKLNSAAEFRRGLTYSPHDIFPCGVRVLRSSNIAEDRFVISSEDVFVKSSAVNIPHVESGDILITAANGSSRLVGKHAVVPFIKEKMVHGGFMLLAHPHKHSAFINALMSAPWYASFISTYIAGGNGAIGNLNKTDLEEQNILFPDDDEQRKIGSLFESIDRLITLHQRNYHLYQNKLAFFLPKEAIAWEQRKLGEIAVFAKGVGYSKNDLTPQGTPIILYGRLYTKYQVAIDNVDTFVSARKNSLYSKGGEVIVPASGETAEDIARASVVLKSGIILGGDLNIIYPQATINPTFLALSISSGENQKKLAQRAQGKSVVHIHNSDLEDVELLSPQLEEQKRIGRYFSELDDLITLHQREYLLPEVLLCSVK